MWSATSASYQFNVPNTGRKAVDCWDFPWVARELSVLSVLPITSTFTVKDASPARLTATHSYVPASADLTASKINEWNPFSDTIILWNWSWWTILPFWYHITSGVGSPLTCEGEESSEELNTCKVIKSLQYYREFDAERWSNHDSAAKLYSAAWFWILMWCCTERLMECCGKMSFSYKTGDAVPASPCCSLLAGGFDQAQDAHCGFILSFPQLSLQQCWHHNW